MFFLETLVLGRKIHNFVTAEEIDEDLAKEAYRRHNATVKKVLSTAIYHNLTWLMQ